jgi:hypothetical protein
MIEAEPRQLDVVTDSQRGLPADWILPGVQMSTKSAL